VNDQGYTAATTYTLTPTTTVGRPEMVPVTYSNVQTVNLNAGTNNDAINVTDTAAAVNTTVTTGPGNNTITVMTTGANSNVKIVGGAGADSVNLQGTRAGGATVILGGNGNDVFNVGNTANALDGILGLVCFDGRGSSSTPQTTLAIANESLTLPVGNILNLND